MTSDEIQLFPLNDYPDDKMQRAQAIFLREIAYQLAVMNEDRRFNRLADQSAQTRRSQVRGDDETAAAWRSHAGNLQIVLYEARGLLLSCINPGNHPVDWAKTKADVRDFLERTNHTPDERTTPPNPQSSSVQKP